MSKELVESGDVKPAIASVDPLERAADAMRYVEGTRAGRCW